MLLAMSEELSEAALTKKLSSRSGKGAILMALIALCIATAAFTYRLTGSGDTASMAYGIAVAISAALWLPTLALKTSVTAGADGICIRWLGRVRFISYDAVSTITRTGNPIHEKTGLTRPVSYFTLTLTDDKKLHFPGAADRVKALVKHGQKQLEAYQSSKRPNAPTELSQTEQASAATRLQSLRRIGAGAAAGPRAAAVHRDELLRIIESPCAVDRDRAAAAIALSSCASEQDQASLRIAAQTTANPALRVVLDSAVSEEQDDDAALNEALETLDEQARQNRKH